MHIRCCDGQSQYEERPENDQVQSGLEALTGCDFLIGGAAFGHSDGTEVARYLARHCSKRVVTIQQTPQRRRESSMPEPSTDLRPQIRIDSTPTCWRLLKKFTKARSWLDVTQKCSGIEWSLVTTSQA